MDPSQVSRQNAAGVRWSTPVNRLDGVRLRRIFAYAIDGLCISILSIAVFLLVFMAGILTQGATWRLIPIIVPATAFAYNGLTISGPNSATWGMRIMDLHMVRQADFGPPTFLVAASHALLFYVFSYTLSPLILLVSLFSSQKRCLHDMILGVLIERR